MLVGRCRQKVPPGAARGGRTPSAAGGGILPPAAGRGRGLEVPRHPDRQPWRHGPEEKPKRGFRVLPRRWVAGGTFAPLERPRRLSKDDEWPPETGETMIYPAMGRIMLCRLAGTNV